MLVSGGQYAKPLILPKMYHYPQCTDEKTEAGGSETCPESPRHSAERLAVRTQRKALVAALACPSSWAAHDRSEWEREWSSTRPMTRSQDTPTASPLLLQLHGGRDHCPLLTGQRGVGLAHSPQYVLWWTPDPHREQLIPTRIPLLALSHANHPTATALTPPFHLPTAPFRPGSTSLLQWSFRKWQGHPQTSLPEPLLSSAQPCAAWFPPAPPPKLCPPWRFSSLLSVCSLKAVTGWCIISMVSDSQSGVDKTHEIMMTWFNWLTGFNEASVSLEKKKEKLACWWWHQEGWLFGTSDVS